MSISSELSRIKAAKESLKLAINARGGTLGNELIDEYASAVSALPSGGDIDLTGVTVTADKLLEGVVAVDGSGSKITGTIQTVTAAVSGDNVVVPAGFHAEAKSFPVSGGADVSGVTVTASDMLKGKMSKNKPDCIAVAFDVSKQTFRLEKYPEYILPDIAREHVQFHFFDSRRTLFGGVAPSSIR